MKNFQTKSIIALTCLTACTYCFTCDSTEFDAQKKQVSLIAAHYAQTENRAPRPEESYGIETEHIPNEQGTAVCCALPRDIHIEGDLNVDGNEIIDENLTVKGSFTVLGPVVFSGNLGLQPLFPTHDACIIWYENLVDGGAEKARLCDSSVLNQKGLSISIDGGITKNFQVDNIGNTDITGNFDLPNSTATTGNTTKAGSIFIHNYGIGNTFMGINSGNSALSGSFNTGYGNSALNFLTTGSENTGIGNNTGTNITSGSSNTILGKDAAFSLSSGNRNIFIGRGASFGVNNSNCIAIQTLNGGGGTQLTNDNQIRIGFNDTANTSCFIDGINTVSLGATANIVGVNGSGQLGTTATTFTLTGNEHITGTSQFDGNVGILKAPGVDALSVAGTIVCDVDVVIRDAGPAARLYAPGTYTRTCKIIWAQIDGLTGNIIGQSGGLISCTYNAILTIYNLVYDEFADFPIIMATPYNAWTATATTPYFTLTVNNTNLPPDLHSVTTTSAQICSKLGNLNLPTSFFVFIIGASF